MKKDVFISYARDDYKDKSGNEITDNAISKIKRALDKAGLTYWLDEDGISAGKQWPVLISHAIENCAVFVFVSSKNSNSSEHEIIKSEISIAHEYNKRIIPFRIDDTRYNTSIVVYLAGREHIAYYTDHEKSCIQLVQAIQTNIEEIKNEDIAKQKEIERCRRIQEIDRELEVQYEQKSSIENTIAESKQTLSKIEQHRDEVISLISDLEDNKKALNGQGRLLQSITSVNGSARYVSVLVAIICILCSMVLSLALIINRRHSEIESYKHDFLKIDTLVSGIIHSDRNTLLVHEFDSVCAASFDTSFHVMHQQGDFIELKCTMPFKITRYDKEYEITRYDKEYKYYYKEKNGKKNGKKNGVLKLQLDSYLYNSDKHAFPSCDSLIYQFRSSGESTVHLTYSGDFYEKTSGYICVTLTTKSTINKILKICVDNIGYSPQLTYPSLYKGNDNNLFD